jgi:hypothetical protein
MDGNELARFSEAMREMREAGESFDSAWEAALRRCGEASAPLATAPDNSPGSAPTGSTRTARVQALLLDHPEMSARAAGRIVGVSCGTAIEARRALVRRGLLEPCERERRPEAPRDALAALASTREAWQRAWAGVPATRGERAVVALLAVLAEVERVDDEAHIELVA